MPKTLSRGFAVLVLAIASLSGPVVAQNRDKPPPAVQAEFNAFVGKFRAAVKANDATAVTAMTKFPFRQMGNHHDENAFRKQVYPKLFTARIRDCVQKARPIYELDGQDNHSFSIMCGKALLLIEKPGTGGEFRFTETHVEEGP